MLSNYENNLKYYMLTIFISIGLLTLTQLLLPMEEGTIYINIYRVFVLITAIFTMSILPLAISFSKSEKELDIIEDVNEFIYALARISIMNVLISFPIYQSFNDKVLALIPLIVGISSVIAYTVFKYLVKNKYVTIPTYLLSVIFISLAVNIFSISYVELFIASLISSIVLIIIEKYF